MNKIDLPVFEMNIDGDDLGMTTISLVDFPAVERQFLVFDKEDKPKKLNFNEDKHLVTGLVCSANKPIYRRDGDFEYYIVFKPETIEKMVYKYSKNGFWNQVNLQHNEDNYTDKVIMTEMFLKNSKRGIAPVEFEDEDDGSLFCTFKIDDERLWRQIKDTNHFNGFSLECYADLKSMNFEKKQENAKDSFDLFIERLLK